MVVAMSVMASRDGSPLVPMSGHVIIVRIVAVLALSSWIGVACSGSEPLGFASSTGLSVPACTGDLASIQQQIFIPSCSQAACHGADEPAATLDLTVPDVDAVLVGVPSVTCDGPRVSPSAPEASILYQKIADAQPACGARMPIGAALSPELVACVQAWIAGLDPGGGGGAGGEGGGSGCETCGGASCVDVLIDPAHCGDCVTACPPGAACAAGDCACGGGLTACGAACVDTALDAAHCGDCVTVCPVGALCSGSQCQCPGGTKACGSACVDTQADPLHCGGCDLPCLAGQVCNQGNCTASCGPLTKCGASCVDTDISAAHCGGCDMPCPAGATCVLGSCQCPQGTSSCNGACINTVSDPANCGGCGVPCGQGTTCIGSACVCPGGELVCGASCVDAQNDPANCGACGKVCAVGQTCVAGSCTCGASSVSFSGAVQPILTASCALNGCHKGVMPQESLDLTPAKSYAALVGVLAAQCNDGRKRVAPGQPSESYLVDKMMDVDLCAGTQMPKLGLVSNAKLQTVVDWICEGAPNN